MSRKTRVLLARNWRRMTRTLLLSVTAYVVAFLVCVLIMEEIGLISFDNLPSKLGRVAAFVLAGSLLMVWAIEHDRAADEREREVRRTEED